MEQMRYSVALVIPNSPDLTSTIEILENERLKVVPCTDIEQLCSLSDESLGCIVLVEDALSRESLHTLQARVSFQPAWSDIPIILVGSHSHDLESLATILFPASGNITMLDRPMKPSVLISAIHVALRSRCKQLEIKALLEKQEVSLRQRDEFLAMLAHELRNPLAPIRNAVFVMSKMKIDDPILSKLRTLIDRQTTHLAKIVDDLLDVARLEKGKVHLNKTIQSVNEMIVASCDAIKSVVDEKKLHLNVVVGPRMYISTEITRFDQILGNILTNALKFTPVQGSITIRTYSEGVFVVIDVHDTGIGMDMSEREFAFDMFKQGNSNIARTTGGLGIGLTIVKRLMDLHGGSVRVTSEGLNKGTTVQLRFPKVDYLPFETKHTETETVPTTKRILIIEDIADIRESLALLLELQGYSVQLAADGEMGVESALSHPPDLAIVDIGLPKLSGYEVAAQIRTHISFPMIALSGYGKQEDIQKAMDAGFNIHLTKPIDPNILLEKIAILTKS